MLSRAWFIPACLFLFAVHTSIAQTFTNSLGMRFVPVPGTKVQFSIWDTRVQDYKAYADAKPSVDKSWSRPGFKQDATHPVVNVSWEDAKGFCAWLTEKEQRAGRLQPGQSYRLPTDLEWSTAVGLPVEEGATTPKERDGKIKDVYPWGNQWPPPKNAGNYDRSLKVDTFDYTSPVGSFAANKFGLFDMGGNVWQRCEDTYFDDGLEDVRVLRGGSWDYSDTDNLLSSYRTYCEPTYRFRNGGFRCVLVMSSSAQNEIAPNAQSTPLTVLKPEQPANTNVRQVLTNSLGMRFVPVPGTKVLFSIWDTRVQDYKAFADAKPGVDKRWSNESHSGLDHPVRMVSWNDAKAFCVWLTEKELHEDRLQPGQSYRLPTDLEWSAAVGLPVENGTTPSERNWKIKDSYPWGGQWPPPTNTGNYSQSLKVDTFNYTSPVGSFAANTFGLFDMGGNVCQWVEDWYNWDQYFKVSRGSSWIHDRRLLSSCRNFCKPTECDSCTGFRCVLAGSDSR